MSDRLTPWFQSSIRPVRPGVYERDYGRQEDLDCVADYQYFDGENWFYGGNDVETAFAEYAEYQSICTYKHDWRGLFQIPDGNRNE